MAVPRSLRELSSRTREWTWIQALVVKAPSPNHRTTREFPTVKMLWCEFYLEKYNKNCETMFIFIYKNIGYKGPSSQSYGFSSGHVWMRELDYKESWAPKNWCFWTVVLEKTLECLLDCKEIKPVLNIHWKDWCWSWNSNALATWCKELTHLRRPWCWERLKAWGEGDDRGWDGLIASPTQWTWVWVNSGSWWWTGQGGLASAVHGVAKSRTRLSDWTELNWGYNDHDRLTLRTKNKSNDWLEFFDIIFSSQIL